MPSSAGTNPAVITEKAVFIFAPRTADIAGRVSPRGVSLASKASAPPDSGTAMPVRSTTVKPSFVIVRRPVPALATKLYCPRASVIAETVEPSSPTKATSASAIGSPVLSLYTSPATTPLPGSSTFIQSLVVVWFPEQSVTTTSTRTFIPPSTPSGMGTSKIPGSGAK